MIFRTFKFMLAFLAISFLHAVALAGEPFELAGQWIVKLDPDDVGESASWFQGFSGTAIELPGICTEAGLGKALSVEMDQEAEVFRHLHQRRSYVGCAWYQRDFEVPDSLVGAEAKLVLERVLWRSKVWVNGTYLGTQDSLSTAHQLAMGDILRAGKNRIVVCVDNREQVPIGKKSHAYTEHTQTIWNGLLGRMQIKTVPKISIESLTVSPEPTDAGVRFFVDVNNRTHEAQSVQVVFGVRPVQEIGEAVRTEMDIEIQAGSQTIAVVVPTRKLKRWSEFSPNLYEAFCLLGEQRVSLKTGFRSVESRQSQILVNGRRSYLRGTLDCCIFPETGYPPTEITPWLERFKTAKAYGLNHVRFHSWCPPESAFAAADQLGIYLQIELPNWTDEMGQDEEVGRFFLAEGERILRSYAHHPSFMFFSLGNELEGDFAFMDRLLLNLQSMARHILMTSTSYSFAERGGTPGPHDQMIITQRTESGWVRGQGFFNQNRPGTEGDFHDGVASVSLPLISHEIGQYSVFPNLEEIEKYDGNLRSLALESIRSDLVSKNRLADARLAKDSSGKLALLLYKEEIERAIRTQGQDGFQLLSLTDFSGQSTATVGILDAFWDSKGLVEPHEFRNFCGPTVPLLRVRKRCFRTSETLTGKVQVGHFAPHALKGTDWKVVVERQDETLFQKEFRNVDVSIGNVNDIGEFEFPLSEVLEPSKLTVSVYCSATDIENHWSMWVYPEAAQPSVDVEIFGQFDDKMLKVLERGGSVLFLPERESIKRPIDGRFVPVFWSPLHFPGQSPTHGTIIKNEHPLFQRFPTAGHTDWQWWELLAKSTSVDMSSIETGFSTPIMRFIDKFNRNAMPAILWEAKVGNGRLFVCSLDINSNLQERPVANALRNSILEYMNHAAFDPADELAPSQLASLFHADRSTNRASVAD